MWPPNPTHLPPPPLPPPPLSRSRVSGSHTHTRTTPGSSVANSVTSSSAPGGSSLQRTNAGGPGGGSLGSSSGSISTYTRSRPAAVTLAHHPSLMSDESVNLNLEVS